MLEKQLLTIVAVIKKMQLKLKKNNISIEELKKLVEDIQEFDNTDNEQMFGELVKSINSLKTLINDNGKEIQLNSISYQDRLKELSTSLETSLNGIKESLKDFITIENINKIETELTDKIKAIKIEPQKEIEIGKVYTLDPGEEAKVEVTKTKDSYKLNFYIPRGVSGRGMPGKGVASGGTTNQVLAKNSNDDYDTKWVTGGSGGTSDHSELTNLDYANSGHTGFQPAGSYVEDASYVHTDNNFTDTFETKLTGIEAGAEVNVQADWNQTTNTADDYIKNKPTIPSAYVLPTASTTVLGGVKIDGSTISITDGVISAATGGGGDVTGPTGATVDNIAVFNSTTGKIIKDGGVKISGLQPAGTYSTDIHANITALNAVSGTNTGDQTSIVGITGTKAQFDTACTDGNFLYSGDVTQYTDEMAQDAVGTILTDSTEIDFTYTDETPSITASIKSASIDETKLDTSVNASLDLADSSVQPSNNVVVFNRLIKETVTGFDVTVSGPIQGVTYDGTYYYVTTATHLYKYNSSGTEIASHDNSGDANTHKYLGDLVYYNSKLYVASSNFDTAGPYTSYAVEFNASDLSYVGEHQYSSDDRGDTITYHNGYFWMPMYGRTIRKYDTSWNFVASYAMNIGAWIYDDSANGLGFDGATWIGDTILINPHEGVIPNTTYSLYFNGTHFMRVAQIDRPTYCTQGIHYNSTTNQVIAAERAATPRVSLMNIRTIDIPALLGSGAGALVNLTATESTTNEADLSIPWDTATYDSDVFWSSGDPTKLVIPYKYIGSTVLVTAGIRWDYQPAGGRYVAILKNGTTVESAVDMACTGSRYSRGLCNVSKTFYSVAEGDYYEIRVNQNSGGALNITNDARTFFQITVIK